MDLSAHHIVLDPGLDSGELAHLIDATVVDGSLNLDADLVTVGHARSIHPPAASPFSLPSVWQLPLIAISRSSKAQQNGQKQTRKQLSSSHDPRT